MKLITKSLISVPLSEQKLNSYSKLNVIPSSPAIANALLYAGSPDFREATHPHYQPFSTLFYRFNKVVRKDQMPAKTGWFEIKRLRSIAFRPVGGGATLVYKTKRSSIPQPKLKLIANHSLKLTVLHALTLSKADEKRFDARGMIGYCI